MTNFDKIAQLQHEIEVEKLKISKCKHVFGNTYYNPTIIKEGYGSVQDGAGSDPHWSYIGYKDVEKPRWTRKCKLCGYEDHTDKKKPIITGYEPSFND